MADAVVEKTTSTAKPFTDRHVTVGGELSVSYKDFNLEKLSFGIPEDKTPDPATGIPAYAYVPIQYTYTVDDRECTKDLYITSPKMDSSKGVLDSYKMDDKDKTGPVIGQTLGVDFNMSLESHIKYMNVLISIYVEAVKFLNNPDTKKSPIGAKLVRFYPKGKEIPNYEEMTNPNMAWAGCSFIVSYRKQGSEYVLTSTPSLWSRLKKGKKSTLFVDKRREKDKEGNAVVDKEGKPVFTFVEIDKSVIEVSALQGFFCHHIQGINANTNTAKIKVMLDQVIVKSVSSKMNSVRKALVDEDDEEEDEDTMLLADSVSLLMPEAEVNAQQKAQKSQKAPKEQQETAPDTVAKSAASVGGSAFPPQALQAPPPQQHMPGPQQYYQPNSTQMQTRYQSMPTFQPEHHMEQMGGYPTIQHGQGLLPQQYNVTRPPIQEQWGTIGGGGQ